VRCAPSEITRTAVGEFSLEQAITLEELAEAKLAGKFAGPPDPHRKPVWLIFPRVNVFTGWSKGACVMARSSILRSRNFSRACRAASRRDEQLDGGEPKAAAAAVFSQQEKLIAMPKPGARTYQQS